MNRQILTLALGLVSLAPLAVPLRAESPELRSWLPEECVAFLEARDLGTHIEKLLASDLMRDLQQTAIGKIILQDDKLVELQKQVGWFRDATEREPLDVLSDLFGREVAVGLRLNLFVPEVVVLSRTAGEAELRKARSAIEKAFEAHEGYVPATDETMIAGHRAERIDKVFVVSLGPVLALSNSEKMLGDVIRLSEGKGGQSLEDSEHFKKVAKAFGGRQALALGVRPEFIPNFKIPKRVENGLASLLFSGYLGSLEASDVLAVRLTPGADSLTLSVESSDGDEGLGSKYRAFFPAVEQSALSRALRKRGVLGFAEIHRDLADWWEHIEDLVDTKGQGEMTQFAQTASLFFGGDNFQDEILPKFGKRISLVGRNLSYEGLEAQPKPAIPGAALIFELADADKFGRTLEAAFNTVVGIVNIERMQKKRGTAPMLARAVRAGSTDFMTVEMGLSAEDASKPGVEHNFSPSLAVVSGRVVLASNIELARILIEELEKLGGETASKSGSKPASSARDRLLLDARQAETILRSNLEFFAAQQMVEKGVTLDEARAEIEAIYELLPFVRDLRLQSWRKAEQSHVELRLRVAEHYASPSERPRTKVESTTRIRYSR